MEKFLVLVCLVAGLQAVTCQSPALESCVYYSYPQQANCLSFTNCTGAQCNITHPSGHASFVVHKCQDPVTVDLTVVTQNSNFQRQFDHSEVANISVYWSYVSVTVSRNATHLLFQATAIFEGDIAIVLIPNVVIPLNPRVCMCQSMQSVSRDIHLPTTVPIQYSCNSTSTCNGVHCRFSDYTSDITVDPCSEEVQLTVYNSDGSTVYQRLLNNSQNVTITLPSNLARLLGPTATLAIVLVHHNYSMEIEISLGVTLPFVGHRTVQVLPPRNITLDKSNCSGNTTTLPPPTSSPHTPQPCDTTTTSSPDASQPTCPTVSQTCQALRTLASSSSFCNTTHSCTMVECQVAGYHSVMTVLPCHTPPALRLVTRSSTGGGVVFNRTLTQSQVIPIRGVVPLLTLNVTVDHVDSETVAIEVDVIIQGQSVTLVPRTAIPIDRSHCPGYTPLPHPSTPSHPHTSTPSHPHTSTPSHHHTSTPSHPHTSTPSHPHMHTHMPPLPSAHTSPLIPTQTPLPTPPCPAMDHMAGFFMMYLSCEISPTCDQLNCTGNGSYVTLMLLPCYNPPAFKMTFASRDDFLWEHTFTQTERVPYANYSNFTLNATLNHISDDVIGVQVDATNMTGGGKAVTYIPYTEVPLDIGSCPSTSEPVKHEGSQLMVAVVVPVSVGLCLAVGVVVVVTVVLVWRQCKKSGQYHFHRMRFSEVKTDADD